MKKRLPLILFSFLFVLFLACDDDFGVKVLAEPAFIICVQHGDSVESCKLKLDSKNPEFDNQEFMPGDLSSYVYADKIKNIAAPHKAIWIPISIGGLNIGTRYNIEIKATLTMTLNGIAKEYRGNLKVSRLRGLELSDYAIIFENVSDPNETLTGIFVYEYHAYI